MRIIACFVAMIMLGQLGAQTILENKQEVSGKWSKKGSPYIIKGEVIIPEGKTLKISAGTVIKFKTGTNREYQESEFDLGFLRVKGTLIAKGKVNDMILFTGEGPDDYWGNIFFENSSGNILEYCKLEKGYYIRGIVADDNGTGVLSFYKSSGMVKNCLIAKNGWTAINCKHGSGPEIINCTITNNEYGLECNTGSNPVVVNTIIWDNNTASYLNGESMPKICFSLFQDNNLEGFEDLGNNVLGKTPGFRNPAGNDYSITDYSPCRKSGKGGTDMGVIFK